MSTDRHARAWLEVSASAVRENLRTLRRVTGGDAPIIPMVKADAYGLGVDRAVAALEPEGPWGYGVATVDEGRELRDLGVKRPVLVFSPVPPDSYRRALDAGLTLCLSDLEGVMRLRDAAAARGEGNGTFHLEVDTGMGRAGMDWRRVGEASGLLGELVEGPLRWRGCYTHFHSADQAGGPGLEVQWNRFGKALEVLPVPDDPGFLVHACNSAAALRSPERATGGVRPGIFLFGGAAGEGLPRPEPVASLRARVVHVREAAPGSTVGYGATHEATVRERWATLSIGYGDGFPWSLGNRGVALLRGTRVPVVGRISMDMTVVDITGLPDVRPGDVATLVGRDGDAAVSLEEVADLAGTINYEILTGLTPRLPRVWVEDAER